MRLGVSGLILLATLLSTVAPADCQSLSSRPAIFADPLLTSDPTQGDLVLGRTSLASALRIFAVELRDSVRIPLGHGSNPDTVRAGSMIGVPSMSKAFYRLDVGPGVTSCISIDTSGWWPRSRPRPGFPACSDERSWSPATPV